jgi:hypothetical protein
LIRRREINDARKSFLKLKPDYAVEFLWIMSKYSACKQSDATALVSSPAIKAHIKPLAARLEQLLADWSEPKVKGDAAIKLVCNPP